MYLAQFPAADPVDASSVGLLAVRLVAGLVMAAHGSQKLFGRFGGGGLKGTGSYFDQLGFRPGGLFAMTAGGGEFLSGCLVALGLLGPIGPVLMVSVMIVAAVSVGLPNGLFAANKGVELPLLYIAIGVGLALIGPGRFSLDAALGVATTWTSQVAWVALLIGVVAGFGALLLRRRKVG